jgi:hypothetical protein
MIEAAFWLDGEWNSYLERGRSHREPLVRDLARRLSQERKHWELARKYLAIVMESREYLHTWCYGQALLELGNEETIRDIRAALPAEVYRRAYLIWLAKELEKRLEKRRESSLKSRICRRPSVTNKRLTLLLSWEVSDSDHSLQFFKSGKPEGSCLAEQVDPHRKCPDLLVGLLRGCG